MRHAILLYRRLEHFESRVLGISGGDQAFECTPRATLRINAWYVAFSRYRLFFITTKGGYMNSWLRVIRALLVLLPFTTSAYAADAKKGPTTDKQMIESAMSAAPAKVSKGATIVAMEADGKMRTLRQGTNGFTCMPDNPATPGPDPMCMDKNSMEWVHAWVAHKQPAPGKVGFMYMLAGGTDASNTDPYAAKPEPKTIGSRPDLT